MIMKTKENSKEKINKKGNNNIFYKVSPYGGISLIVLVITILFSYDEKLKCSNSKGFLLATI